jgi:hypothetical protein
VQPTYPQSGFIPPATFSATITSIGRSIFSTGFLGFFYVLVTLLVIALITLILYLLVRLYEIRQEEKKKLKPTVVPASMPSSVTPAGGAAHIPAPTNETWRRIREHLLSDNTSDWKLGVIEADIYMDRVLDDKGFHGDTTSDKLKQVTPDKLPSIQIAWEMHKVRNNIAHQGAAFVLTMPEARRMLSFYEMIFTDLGVI